MLKLSLKLDVSLRKLVFGFVGLSAAVYYLSSKSKNKDLKLKGASSSKGNNKFNDLTVYNLEVSEQTHIEKEHIFESKGDESNIENNALQYFYEESQKQIFFDKYESFKISKQSQTLNKIPLIPDTNATFPNKSDIHDAVDKNKISNVNQGTNQLSVQIFLYKELSFITKKIVDNTT